MQRKLYQDGPFWAPNLPSSVSKLIVKWQKATPLPETPTCHTPAKRKLKIEPDDIFVTPPAAKTKLAHHTEDRWTGRGPCSKTWFRGELFDMGGTRAQRKQNFVSTATTTIPIDSSTELLRLFDIVVHERGGAPHHAASVLKDLIQTKETLRCECVRVLTCV